MNVLPDDSRFALQQAQNALRGGDRLGARRWAERAAALEPNREDAWLILAGLASPRASVEYLKRALEINPQSERARRGMHWAAQRLRREQPTRTPLDRPTVVKPVSEALYRPRLAPAAWAVIALFFIGACLLWFASPRFTLALGDDPISLALAQVGKATRTPTATATFTPTPTFTATATFTPTPTFTPSPTPTDTPTATPTETPTNTPEPTEPPPPPPPAAPQAGVSLPEGVGPGERWIYVDLSEQRTYAFEGENLINSFIVSTGTWQYPTVTGTFKVYVKYRRADMSGPGYYLPQVPYVMYFFKGYGLHGTYWHNNFGTPMSHGCVNLTTEDAGWMFDFASVGTVVHVSP